MAKATKTQEHIPIQPPVIITLTLSKEEAEALQVVLGRIGGVHEARSYTSKIFYALDEIGIPSTRYELENGIRFKGSV